MEELPQGDEFSGVNPKGDRVSRADGRGQGGDGNSPATRDNKAIRDSSIGEEMASGPRPAPPPNPQRGMAAGRGSKVSTRSHPYGAVGARPKHGALARRENGLLAPEEPVGDPAAAEPN